MSRSRKRNPVSGITSASSEKEDKVAAHRRERRKVRQAVATEPDAEVLPHTREVSNVWAFAKDGKRYRRGATPDDHRK